MTAVITGVGCVSAFGVGAPVLLGALAEGRSGVRGIRSFDASTFPVRVAGEVPVAVIDGAWLASKLAVGGAASDEAAGTPVRGAVPDAMLELVRELDASGALRDRKIAFGLAAAEEAWRSAGCGDAEREASLVIALGLEQAFLDDFAPIFEHATGRDPARIAWAREPAALSQHARDDRDPAFGRVRFRSPVDLCARGVRRLLALRGPAIVNASACAAGALAVAHAASLVERGAASVVVCGAADSMVNPLGLGGMARLGAPSPRADAEDACRPFDRARDGLAIGEGAAMFIVEDETRAKARGACVLARILGWGSTQDAYRATAPRPDGAAARVAIERALARAARGPHGVPARAIGYINAHGTGTPLNDPAECKAIRGAFGAHADAIAVSSIKGAVGHLMAASGAIELAASLLAFERDLLPGTAHHRERDPECDVDVIGPAPRAAKVEALLSTSFGFGGQNAALVLGRPS